jgi:hypothetical protein
MTDRGVDRLDGLLSGGANPAYLAFHRPRFRFLIDTLRGCALRDGCRLLDVGASPLTSLLSKELNVRVDSLGLEPDREIGGAHHYHFDLNDTQYRDRWRMDLGPYDVILFAEVLEHLYTAPELVLGYLRELLVPSGLLLLQTPNAVALRKRAKIVMGVNPFERIRLDRDNPGHFREYTVGELRELLAGAGFSIDEVWMRYYSDARYARHERGDEPPRSIVGAAKNAAYGLLPERLREGITIAARKCEITARRA